MSTYPSSQERKLTESTWALIEKTADHIWNSGVAQECKLKHRGAVVLILLKGWELGLPLMSALEHVRLIHGHFSLSAESQQALVLGRVPGAKFQWISDGKNGTAEVAAERPGHARVTVRFTHEDAQKTGMAERNPIYRTFPANLLRSAAMRGLCKRLFPDVLLGVDSSAEDGEQPSQAEAEAETVKLPQRSAVVAQEASEPQVETQATVVGREPARISLPEDCVLPFTKGKWHGRKLSEVDMEELGALERGFAKRHAEATEAGSDEGAKSSAVWLERVRAWTEFRSSAAPSAAA